jgi:hypothetical protein
MSQVLRLQLYVLNGSRALHDLVEVCISYDPGHEQNLHGFYKPLSQLPLCPSPRVSF